MVIFPSPMGEGLRERVDWKNEEPSLEIVSFRQRLKDNFTLSLGESCAQLSFRTCFGISIRTLKLEICSGWCGNYSLSDGRGTEGEGWFLKNSEKRDPSLCSGWRMRKIFVKSSHCERMRSNPAIYIVCNKISPSKNIIVKKCKVKFKITETQL